MPFRRIAGVITIVALGITLAGCTPREGDDCTGREGTTYGHGGTVLHCERRHGDPSPRWYK